MGNRVSVAMAVCNGEKYLPVQIESILPQLKADDELVISYDRSDDNTLGIIEKYAAADSRIRILTNEAPGVTGNFSSAISGCTGDFIFLSDQDDRWMPDKVEKVMACFLEKKADLVIHNGIHTDAELNPVGAPFSEIYRIGNGKLKNILKPRMSGCCMAFTKEMKERILPMPEIHGYDQWIALVCECLGHIEYPEEILILHRLHEGNVTPTSSRPLPVVLKLRAGLVLNLARRVRRERRRKP